MDGRGRKMAEGCKGGREGGKMVVREGVKRSGQVR